MDERMFELLVDLHLRQARQGPGSPESTRQAIELARLDGSRPLRIADLGCGTGASALVLAEAFDARITAVDLSAAFLQQLEERAAAIGLDDRIETLEASIDDLPFEDECFDGIWSEGAIYNIGFEAGLQQWRRLLKPGGVLAVSEIIWTTPSRPSEIEAFWGTAYPAIAEASDRIEALERAGYVPIGHFTLPARCWLDEYYEPLEAGFDAFLAKHSRCATARSLVDEHRDEIALYRRYGAYYSYGMFIARRFDGGGAGPK